MTERSPLFEAQHADRYERQTLICGYEDTYKCRLVVLVDVIFAHSVTYFEELVCDADPATDLHLLLYTPGGDGEIAVRLTRAAQARCRNLTVIVPDLAKSAGTLLAIGAHYILMGPTSDLGPVDPQFEIKPGSLVSAKDIIAAVDDATRKVQEAPETYPLHASLLSDVTALMVQQARSALARTTDLLEEALKSNPNRTEEEVAALKAKLKKRLVDVPQTHSAILGASEAARIGLPVTEADPTSEQWRAIWRLWARYFALGSRVYEGARASQVIPWVAPT